MKNIIISGAGEVGKFAAQELEKEGHSVSVIECSNEAIKRLENICEARLIQGSSTHSVTLKEAGIEKCDVLMAATSLDEINLLTASIGKKMGAKTVMARVHNSAYFDQEFSYPSSLGIDYFICPDLLTARSICADLNDPGESDLPRFAQNELELRTFIIGKKSSAIGKTLRDLHMPPGVRVALINRDKKTFAPEAHTPLVRLDEITVIGPTDCFTDVMNIFGERKVKHQTIAISGGSDIAEWILKEIDHDRFTIKFFETDPDIAEKFALNFPSITVIGEDPVETDIFDDEHLETCTAFLAVGDNQEHNILGAIQAKKLGIASTFAIIHNSSLLSVLGHTGIDHPYSPRIEAAKELAKFIDDSSIRMLASLDPKHAIIYEVKVSDTYDSEDKSLIELNFPPTSFIAAIQRGEKVFSPVRDDRVKKGDILICIGPPMLEPFLKITFNNEKK
jgi:trk system potassium uptake protein TrkA